MRHFSERYAALALGAAMLLPPLYTEGRLDLVIGQVCRGVESLVAGCGGMAVPADARLVADRRLASRARDLLRRSGEQAPSVEALLPHVSAAREAARRHGVPITLVLAVIHMESRFRQEAISPSGALGLMQVMPATARAVALSEGWPLPRWLQLLDSETNIEIGVALLRSLHDHYHSWERALAAYYAGNGALVEGRFQQETEAYVRQVGDGVKMLHASRAGRPSA